MARYQAILAYDGTDFKGFQRQAGKTEKRTVQSVFEAALKNIGWTGRAVLSAGRTDTGVHASGQVAAFDLEWQHSADQLLAALNAHLPSDVAVREVQAVTPGFHPRYDAICRSYEYRLFADPVRDPRRERYAWRIWPDVNLERMQTGTSCLPGTHDFRSFGRAPHSGGSTIRAIYQADWHIDREDFIFEIRGSGFLYRMVRKLVGFLVEIGQERVEPETMKVLLQEKSPELVKSIAPAHGLTLVAVEYESIKLEQ